MNNMNGGNGSPGYIALLAVLIVSAVSLAAATSMLLVGSDSLRGGLALQQSVQARGVSSACAEEALQRLRALPSFTGAGSLTFETGTCSYEVTDSGGSLRTVVSTGTVQAVVRKITVSATVSPEGMDTVWQDSY